MAFLSALPAGTAAAQEVPIRDNSFLVEEAYNQEAGVVQHTGLYQLAEGGAGWELALGQEWPLGGQRHQLSFTVPLLNVVDGTGIGDIALSYRHQLRGGEGPGLALAPRLSAYLPTGSEADGRGAGGLGIEGALPASIELGPLAFHANASVLVTPSAQNLAGVSATTVDLGLGGSVVWLATPGVNLLVEAVWRRAQEVVGPGRTGAVSELYLAPGLRAAIDLPGGVQVVPGVGWAIPAAFDAREGVLLAYLSVEHPFGSRLTPGAAPGQLGRVPNQREP